jgi:Mn2+/Fe2+ NRAMP family transporter
VINGVVAVPLMAIIMLMAMRQDVMGQFVLPRALWVMGWLCTGVMTVVVAIMFVTW